MASFVRRGVAIPPGLMLRGSPFERRTPRHIRSPRGTPCRAAASVPETSRRRTSVCRAGCRRPCRECFSLRSQMALSSGNEAIGRAQVAVELRNLVFENPVVPERVPGEIRQHPVILMPVVPVVREHEIGVEYAVSATRIRL